MNPKRLVVVVLSSALTLIAAPVVSCKTDASRSTEPRRVTEIDPNATQDGSGDGGMLDEAGAVGMDVEIPEMMRELQNAAQGLQVMMTAYDAEIREAEVGKYSGTTPPVKAFSADVIEDVKAARARLRQVGASEKLRPASSLLSDRLKFESQASLSHMRNVPRDMFNSIYANRRIDAATTLLRIIDEEIARVFTGKALEQELATVRYETERRLTRAEALRDGLMNGPGSSDGMFEDPDDPGPPPPLEEPMVSDIEGGAP